MPPARVYYAPDSLTLAARATYEPFCFPSNPGAYYAADRCRDDCRPPPVGDLFPIYKRLPTEREAERVAYALSLSAFSSASRRSKNTAATPRQTIADPTGSCQTNH